MIAAIVNPKSAGGKTGAQWSAIKAVLERELGTFTVLETRQKLAAIDLTRQALKDGAEMIISVGGDGTLNEVVNGFFYEWRVASSDGKIGSTVARHRQRFYKNL